MFLELLGVKQDLGCDAPRIHFDYDGHGRVVLLIKECWLPKPSTTGKPSRKLLPTPGRSTMHSILFCFKMVGSPIPEHSSISGVLREPGDTEVISESFN